MRDDWWPWLLRLLWLSLPFTSGTVLGDALVNVSRPVELTAAIALWGLWAIGLALSLIPHVLALTPLRILAPASLTAAVWATVEAGASASAVIALAVTATTATVSLAPQIGAWFVNGTAYGDERRILLRPPGALLLGPIPIAWAAIVATVYGAPLLLASRQWVAGALVAVIGGALSLLAMRSLHALTRRWLVFVPAGIVVHDLMTLADPVLIKRSAIDRLGPALADSEATDLTMAAIGLALEVRVGAPVTLALRPKPGAQPQAIELTSLLISPSRPGAVLDEAEQRNTRVG